VTGNTAYDNEFDGINAGYSTVTGNAAHNNGLNGIRVSSGAQVKGNTASHNVLSNIQAESADNAIEENLVTNSAKGIYFLSSGNFYANNRASGNGIDFDFGGTTQTDGGGNIAF
jgi:parallel beta-helix repeat protein